MFPKLFNLGSIFKRLEYVLYFNICSHFTHFFFPEWRFLSPDVLFKLPLEQVFSGMSWHSLCIDHPRELTFQPQA